MGLRLAANLGDAPREAVEHQPPLDEFFRVGIDVDRASPPLQVLDSFEQVLHVIDIAAAQLAECLVSLRVQLLGQKQAQRCPIAVLHVNADCPAFIWPLQFRGREPPLQLRRMCLQVPSVFVRKSGHEQYESPGSCPRTATR